MTLLGDIARPGGVTFAFTERTGGVSQPPYASLNLGSRCGDSPEAVEENRARALAALGAGPIADRLLEPKQVHGDRVVTLLGRGRAGDAAPAESAAPPGSVAPANEPLLAGTTVTAGDLGRARAEALDGADAIVCTTPGVPVFLCFADCVPVVLCAPGGFAVAHSGWRGTFARISAKALVNLCESCGCAPAEVSCYVGPHISEEDYEVSEELLASFEGEFGKIARAASGERNLDLAAVICATLTEAGASPERICVVEESTASHTDRFFSYRAEGGTCGRHAAIAYL